MGASSVFAEVYTWRITAVVLWGGALAFWAAAVWSLDWSIALTPLRLLAAPWRLLSPLGEAPAWVLGALVAASCAPLLAMHVVLLRTTEPLPLPGATASAASHSSLLALLCRAGGRLRTLADTARTAAFVLACAVTGALFMGLFPLVKASSHGQAFRYNAATGATLGLVHSLAFIVRGRDVLSFPFIQRRRIFRVKQRMPSAAASAARTSVTAVLVVAALQQALPASFPPVSGDGPLLVLLIGALLLTFAWECLIMLVEVIFTERVDFERQGGSNPLNSLLAALKASNHPLIQEYALHDLCIHAERRGSPSWLREAVFGDEQGTTWAAVAQPCVTEVNELIAMLAGALQQPQGRDESSSKAAKTGEDGGRTHAKWNSRALDAKLPSLQSKGHAATAWHLRSRHRRLELSVRTLTGLVSASLKEDRFGVVQLRSPALGDCVVSLLAALTVLRQYIRLTCSTPSRRSPSVVQGTVMWISGIGATPAPVGALSLQEVDTAAYSMEDMVRTGVHNLVHAFGDSLQAVVRSHSARAPYGSKAELEACLKTCTDDIF
eukprot:jgi/Tetstr1/435591/TSEL_024494.t1